MFTDYHHDADDRHSTASEPTMRALTMSILLLLTSGLPLMVTGPLLADPAAAGMSGHDHRLAKTERRLMRIDLVGCRPQIQVVPASGAGSRAGSSCSPAAQSAR